MAKKLPLKYFPGLNAAIKLKKVDMWAEMWARQGTQPYFDTWKEAHSYMLEKAIKKQAQLEKELASAKRHLAKVRVMLEPDA